MLTIQLIRPGDLKKSEQAVQKAEQRATGLREEFRSFKLEHSGCASTITDKDREISTLDSTVKRLQQQLHESEEGKHGHQSRLLEYYKSEAESNEASSNDWMDKYHGQEKELLSSNQEIDRLRLELANANSYVTRLDEDLASSNADYNKVKNLNDRLRRKVEEGKDTVEQVQRAHQQDVEALETKLDTKRAIIQRLSALAEGGRKVKAQYRELAGKVKQVFNQ